MEAGLSPAACPASLLPPSRLQGTSQKTGIGGLRWAHLSIAISSRSAIVEGIAEAHRDVDEWWWEEGNVAGAETVNRYITADHGAA